MVTEVVVGNLRIRHEESPYAEGGIIYVMNISRDTLDMTELNICYDRHRAPRELRSGATFSLRERDAHHALISTLAEGGRNRYAAFARAPQNYDVAGYTDVWEDEDIIPQYGTTAPAPGYVHNYIQNVVPRRTYTTPTYTPAPNTQRIEITTGGGGGGGLGTEGTRTEFARWYAAFNERIGEMPTFRQPDKAPKSDEDKAPSRKSGFKKFAQKHGI